MVELVNYLQHSFSCTLQLPLHLKANIVKEGRINSEFIESKCFFTKLLKEMH